MPPASFPRNIFVIQTAFVYCERFYAKRSLLRNDRFVSMQGLAAWWGRALLLGMQLRSC